MGTSGNKGEMKQRIPVTPMFLLLLFCTLATSKLQPSKLKKLKEGCPACSDWQLEIFDAVAAFKVGPLKMGSGNECYNALKKGKKPVTKHSPCKTFGIKRWENGRNSAFPTAQLEFGTVNIGKGEQIYLFAGSTNELLAFCACYEKVNIKGTTLSQDGKWGENTGTIKIQIENVAKYPEAATPFDVIFAYTLEKIAKALDPASKIVAVLDEKILGELFSAKTVDGARKVYEKIRSVMPMHGDDWTALDIYSGGKTIQEKLKLLKEYFMKKDKEDAKNKWQDEGNVSKSGRLLVTLCMTPKSPNRVRSTFNLGVSSATFHEVGEALKKFFKMSSLGTQLKKRSHHNKTVKA